MISLVDTFIGSIVGVFLTIIISEILPDKIKQKIKFFIKKIKTWIKDSKIPSTFIWRYEIDMYISDIDSFISSLKNKLIRAGFSVRGTYSMIVEKQDRQFFTIDISYDDDESKLLSIYIKINNKISLKHFDRDILTLIENPEIKRLLRQIKEFIREHNDDVEPVLFMELQLKGLSSLSLLVEDLGIKLALADSKYKLLIGEEKVSMHIEGFTKELLGLIHRLALLYG